MLLTFNQVSFTYEGVPNSLFEGITVSFPVGWTGIVGANGAGKTTILRLACGELDPRKGWIHWPGQAIYCPQRTDSPPEGLADFLQSLDPDACELRGKLKIGDDWLARWDSLSHGERKRAQIATALSREPLVLALDEPTNHIDADAREMLIHALDGFRGIGLLVSHDREMLDSLCRQCAFADPPQVIIRPGNYTEASHQAALDDQYVRDEYDKAKDAAQRLRRELARRRAKASRGDARRSKRKLASGDSDAREKIDRARASGADGKAGQLASQMDARVHRAESRFGEFKIKRRYETSFWLPGSRSQRDTLFRLPEGNIEIGGGRRLHFPELAMTPDARITVTGPNGSGKSTLIRHVLGELTLPQDKVIYVPQEISLTDGKEIMREVNSLTRERLGTVMTVVSCLGSRPERLVGSLESSPGEIRKVLLALGVSNAPHLIIMDEPTNHLDLPAIESLEDALADCPCGLLLVSHDRRFLSRLASARWHLSPEKNGDTRLVVMGMD